MNFNPYRNENGGFKKITLVKFLTRHGIAAVNPEDVSAIATTPDGSPIVFLHGGKVIGNIVNITAEQMINFLGRDKTQ